MSSKTLLFVGTVPLSSRREQGEWQDCNWDCTLVSRLRLVVNHETCSPDGGWAEAVDRAKRPGTESQAGGCGNTIVVIWQIIAVIVGTKTKLHKHTSLVIESCHVASPIKNQTGLQKKRTKSQ